MFERGNPLRFKLHRMIGGLEESIGRLLGAALAQIVERIRRV